MYNYDPDKHGVPMKDIFKSKANFLRWKQKQRLMKKVVESKKKKKK